MRVLVMHDDRRVARKVAAALREEGETHVEIRPRSLRRSCDSRPLEGSRSLRSLQR